jgi:hypothetical protein
VGREPKAGVSGGQAALAAIMVGGIGLTALLLRPDSPLFAKGKGPLGGKSLVVVALAAAWLGAGLLVNGRYRRGLDYDRRLAPVEQRLADTVRYVLATIPFALPVLLLALHRFDARKGPPPPPPTNQSPSLPHIPSSSPLSSTRHAQTSLPGWLAHTFVIIGIVLFVALAAFAALFLWRLFHRPVRKPYGASYGSLDDEQESLAQAVDSGRRALLDGDDARAAVIACYAAMETSLAASGIARRASDSPQDLLERASAGGLLTGPAPGALTVLFREARYSTHPMDPGHRDRAAAALTEIAAQLDRRAAASAQDTADAADTSAPATAETAS